MFWFRRKEKPALEFSTAINISKNTFYPEERPTSPKHHMICVAPNDGDEAECFCDFMRLCAGRLLAEYPFVVEQVRNAVKQLRSEPFINEFLDSGGKVVLPNKERLLAISERQKLRLIALLPERSLNYYWCDIYAFRDALSVEQLLDSSFDLRASEFAIHLYCSEWHDYFLIESTQNLNPFIDVIRSVCQEQGRELIIESDNQS